MYSLLTEYNAIGGGADSGCDWIFNGRRLLDTSDPFVGNVSLNVDGVTATYQINDTIGSNDNPIVDFLNDGYEYEFQYSCPCGDTAIVLFQLEDCCINNDPGLQFQFDGNCLEILPVGMVADTSSDVIEWRKSGGTYQNYTGLLCGCDIYETFDVNPICGIFSGGIFIGWNSPTYSCSGRDIDQLDILFGDGTNQNSFGFLESFNSTSYTTNDWVNVFNRTITFKIFVDTPVGTIVKQITYTYTGVAGAAPSCANISISETVAPRIYYAIEARRTVNYSNCPVDIVTDIWDAPNGCLVDVTLILANGGGGTELISSVVKNCTGTRTNVWFKDGILLNGETGVSVDRNVHGFGQYDLIVTCDGCSASGSIVYQPPCAAAVSISQSGSTLTANVTGCTTSVSYTWQIFNGATWDDVGTNSSTYNPSLSGTYRVLIVCGGCSALATIYYTVPCTLNVSIINNDPVFNSSVTGCADTPIYLWEFFSGGTWLFRSSATSYSPTETGTYRLTVTCGECIDFDLESFTIVSCDGSVTISITDCDMTSTIMAIASPTYDWQIDNNGIWDSTGGLSPSFTGQDTERYRLRVLDSNGCEYFSNVLIASCPPPPNCNCVATLGFDAPNCQLLLNITGTTCGSWFLQFSATGNGGWISKLNGTGSVDTTYNVDENGYYRLVVVGTGSCPNSDTVPIEVDCLADPCEVFSAGITGTSPVCLNTPVTLSAVASNGSGLYNYSWSHGGGTGSTATFSSPTVGTIAYSVTITDIVNNCEDTATFPVTYETCVDPCVNFMASISGNLVVCGNTTVLTASSSGGIGNPSYLWSEGQTTQSITVGSGNYSVLISEGLCTETAVVTVTTQTLVNVNVGANQTVDCDETININALVSPNVAGSWSGGLGSFESGAASKSNVYFPIPSEIGTTVMLTYTVPAFGACPSVFDSLNIIIRPCCALVVNILGDTDPCGSSTFLTADVTGANGSVTYLWSNGQTSSSISLTGSGTQNISVDVTDGVCTVSDIETITFSPLNMSDAGLNVNVCDGASVQLSANTPPVGSIGAWSGFSGTMSNVNDPTATLTPNGSQTLTWTVSGGTCPNSTDTVLVTVLPLPIANAGGDKTVCIGDGVMMTASGIGVWSGFAPGAMSSITSPNAIFTPTVSQTNVTLTWSVSNSCGSDSDDVSVTVEDCSCACIVSFANDGDVICRDSGAINFVPMGDCVNPLNGVFLFDGSVINAPYNVSTNRPAGIYNYSFIGTDDNGCDFSFNGSVEIVEVSISVVFSCLESFGEGSQRVIGLSAITTPVINGEAGTRWETDFNLTITNDGNSVIDINETRIGFNPSYSTATGNSLWQCGDSLRAVGTVTHRFIDDRGFTCSVTINVDQIDLCCD